MTEITEIQRMSLISRVGEIPPDAPPVALWLACQYESANHPMYATREGEYQIVRQYAEHYGITLSENDFDWAMAIRFGGGAEFEWR